jgi:alkylation response protein AidB-like acyl-CoA dehydrogenase
MVHTSSKSGGFGMTTYAPTLDQAELVAAVRDFAQHELAPHAVEWDQTKHFPTDVLRAAGEMGLGGIYAGEDVGGSGLTRSDAVLIFEELGKGDTTIAAYISIHNMVVWMIDHFGSTDQRERWIPGLASMDQLGSYCLTEPGAGSDAAALTTSARRDGDEYVINGVKQFISGAGSSALYVVMARTGGAGASGITAIVVPDGTPGLSFGAHEKKMGWNAQPTRQVIFEDCKVPAANRVGEEGKGFRFAMSGLDGGRINIGACSLGAAWSALEKARAYMLERKAFGRQIADFQALQFKIADMATELEASRLMIYRAADALDRSDPQASMYSAMGKRLATDLGFKVCNEALQIHGGYGYLKDYGLEKLVRDLRVHQILEGTNEIMRVVISRKVLGGNRG